MLVRLTETAVRLLPPARGNSRAWPGEYLWHLPADPDWRFDPVSVYYDRSRVRPAPAGIELFKNACGVS